MSRKKKVRIKAHSIETEAASNNQISRIPIKQVIGYQPIRRDKLTTTGLTIFQNRNNDQIRIKVSSSAR